MTPAANARHRLVMLIDDNEVDNFIARQLIIKTNFGEEILIFKKTKDALEKLITLRSLTNPSPTCIFLNIADEKGLDFLYDLNSLKLSYISSLSIFILSNCTDPSVKAEALLFKNVKGWIQKPLKISDLNFWFAPENLRTAGNPLL